MNILDTSINKHILTVGGLSVDYLVLFNNPGDRRQSETRRIYPGEIRNGDNNKYSRLYLQHTGMIKLQCTKGTGDLKSDAVFITQKNVLRFCKGLKKIIKLFDRDDLFYIDENNNLSMYPNDHIISISHLGDNKHIKIIPDIVSDVNQNTYEGCRMYINKVSNIVYLTYDELCLLLYIIQKVDFFLYTQNLLIYNELRKASVDKIDDSSIGKDISSGILGKIESIKVANKENQDE